MKTLSWADGPLLIALSVAGAAALSVPAAASADDARTPAALKVAAAKRCGIVTITGDGRSRRLKLTTTGGARCRTARRVARGYDDKRAGGSGCRPRGGNTCPLRIGRWRCVTPTAASFPRLLACSRRRGIPVTIDGWHPASAGPVE